MASNYWPRLKLSVGLSRHLIQIQNLGTSYLVSNIIFGGGKKPVSLAVLFNWDSNSEWPLVAWCLVTSFTPPARRSFLQMVHVKYVSGPSLTAWQKYILFPTLFDNGKNTFQLVDRVSYFLVKTCSKFYFLLDQSVTCMCRIFCRQQVPYYSLGFPFFIDCQIVLNWGHLTLVLYCFPISCLLITSVYSLHDFCTHFMTRMTRT